MCYKARCVETSREYALKVANGETLTRKLKDKLSIEIRIHRELSHASIVRLDRCFEDVGGSVYLLLELCEHRSLADYVRRNGLLGETEVRRHAVQLSEAVSYLHERRIIHRDLKVSAPLSIARARRRLSCARGSRAATAVEPVARLEPAPQAQRLWTRGDAQAGE